MSRPHEIVMPASIAAPAARYAHAVLVTSPTRWLHTSGVVPVRPDGTVPDGRAAAGLGAQAQVIWSNIAALLAEVAMGPEHIVSVTTYVVAATEPIDLSMVMSARDDFLGGRRVASTLVTVPMLAQPQWLVESAVVAAS